MSESAPRDNTDAPSGCGDAGCKDGVLEVKELFGYDKIGRKNWLVKHKVKIFGACLLCAIAAVKA